jgi:putative flippase GtrA
MTFATLLRSAVESEKHRFLAVGAYNTIFGYGLFSLLYLLFGNVVHYLVILPASHVVAVTNAYYAYRIVVFRNSHGGIRSYLRFHFVQLANLGFGMIALPLLVEVVGLYPILAQAVVVAISVILSYVIHKKFTFAK